MRSMNTTEIIIWATKGSCRMLSSTRALFMTSYIITTGDASSCRESRGGEPQLELSTSFRASAQILLCNWRISQYRDEDRRDSKSMMNTKIFYACKVCGSGGCSGDLTIRAYWHCKEWAMVATREEYKAYLHYHCLVEVLCCGWCL